MNPSYLLGLAALLALVLLWKKPLRRAYRNRRVSGTRRATSTRRAFRLQAAAAGGILLFLTGSVAVMSLLWLQRGSTPPRPPAVLAQLPQEAAGVYLDTGSGYQPLPEWHLPLQQAPEGTPALPLGADLAVLVIQKQPYPADQYQLFRLETGALLAWQDSSPETGLLRLVPDALAAGDYMLLNPTNDMFGGEVFYYFRVQ